MPVEITVDLGNLEAFVAALPAEIDKRLYLLGQEMASRASANAPRETSSLAEGIAVVGSSQSDWEEKASVARGLNPKAEIWEQPEVPASGEIVVGPTVKHGYMVENGTKRMAAQPYLVPAEESMQGADAESFFEGLA